MAKIIIKNSTEPSTPTTGDTAIYIDSSTKRLASKDDAGNVVNYESDTDELVKVSANDTTAGYLESKIVAGSNVTITTLNDGANETLQISSSGGGGGVDLENELDIIQYLYLPGGYVAPMGSLQLRDSRVGSGALIRGLVPSATNKEAALQLIAGSGVNGRSLLYTAIGNGSEQFRFDSTITRSLEFFISINTLGDPVTERIRCQWGFGSSATQIDQSQGAYFQYRPDDNGGRFSAITARAGVRTQIDTGITPVVDQIYRMKIEWTGTEMRFFIDNVLVGTSTTNINDGSYCGMVFGVLRLDAFSGDLISSMHYFIRYKLFSTGRLT